MLSRNGVECLRGVDSGIPSIFWQETELSGTAGLTTAVARTANLSSTSTCPYAAVANCTARQAGQ